MPAPAAKDGREGAEREGELEHLLLLALVRARLELREELRRLLLGRVGGREGWVQRRSEQVEQQARAVERAEAESHADGGGGGGGVLLDVRDRDDAALVEHALQQPADVAEVADDELLAAEVHERRVARLGGVEVEHAGRASLVLRRGEARSERMERAGAGLGISPRATRVGWEMAGWGVRAPSAPAWRRGRAAPCPAGRGRGCAARSRSGG